jgi:hypothetical protein
MEINTMPIPGRRAAAKAPVTQRGHFRGEEGRRRAEEELVKAKAKAELRKEQGNMPFRYRISPGESGSFVILDDEPNFYRFEHNNFKGEIDEDRAQRAQ